jgi:hypothetical protein
MFDEENTLQREIGLAIAKAVVVLKAEDIALHQRSQAKLTAQYERLDTVIRTLEERAAAFPERPRHLRSPDALTTPAGYLRNTLFVTLGIIIFVALATFGVWKLAAPQVLRGAHDAGFADAASYARTHAAQWRAYVARVAPKNV